MTAGHRHRAGREQRHLAPHDVAIAAACKDQGPHSRHRPDSVSPRPWHINNSRSIFLSLVSVSPWKISNPVSFTRCSSMFMRASLQAVMFFSCP
jgi:hypothetical protein